METRNVLIAVDIQNDFITGSLAVKDGEQVVEPINQVARAVRQNLGQVAFTRDWHPAATPHFDIWPVHCVAETEGAAFHPDLKIETSDIVLDKGTGQTDGYSGVEGVAPDGTTLEKLITPQNEKVAVFIGGLATDYCVKATAIDIAKAFEADARVNVYALYDAMQAVNIDPVDGPKALKTMKNANVKMITVKQALAMIDQTRLER